MTDETSPVDLAVGPAAGSERAEILRLVRNRLAMERSERRRATVRRVARITLVVYALVILYLLATDEVLALRLCLVGVVAVMAYPFFGGD